MTIVDQQVQNILFSLTQQYGDFRTKQEYGISAFWYWYYQVKQYIYNLHTHNIRYGIRNVHRIPQWGTLIYSKYKIGREILVVAHEFDYSQRNLWNWLNHKSNRRPSYSVCDTCFGFSSVLYDNSQKYGILKPDGKPLVKPIFDDIINFHHSSNDYNTLHAIGFINDRVYEITTDGNVILLHMSKDDYLNAIHKFFEAKQRCKIIENKQYNTMKNTRNKVRLTESQLHQVIKESVKKVLSELDWKTKQAAADERQRRNNDVMQNGRNSQYFNKYQQQGLAQGSNYGDFAMMQPKAYQQQRNNQQAANDQFTQDYGYDESNMDGSTYTSNKLGLNYNGTGVSTTKARFTPNMSSSQNVSTSFNDGNYSLNASGKRNYNNNPSLNSDGSVGAMVGNNNYQSMVQNGNTKLAFNAYQNLAANNPQFDNANNEVMNYRNGNYEYIKDKGWQLKK